MGLFEVNGKQYNIPSEMEIDFLKSMPNAKRIESFIKLKQDNHVTLVSLFEEQVKSTPFAISVVYNDHRLTYQELNESANLIANALISDAHIKPNDQIILCLDKSDVMLMTLIAVLKTGASYVPVSPKYPLERIEYIVNDTDSSIIITNSRYRFCFSSLNAKNDVQVLLIEDYYQNKIVDKHRLINIEKKIFPESLAYIIYTSGTTGKPKGVMVEHRSVINLISSSQKIYHFSSNDIWTLFHSYTFDFSVWEIWGSLLNGGTLVIPTDEENMDLNLFYNLCVREKVTILNQTPNVFYQLSNIIIDKQQKLNLRYVIFGGEALNFIQLKTWFEK